MKGKFITVEGVEGVGKSTNVDYICRLLEEKGKSFVRTREPGGTPLAEEVRQLLLCKRKESVDPTAELLLVFAARAQHLNKVILPALDRGDWVLSDRFTDATFAYQGAGRGLSVNTISALEQLVQKDIRPDLTIVLDLSVEVGIKRAQERGELDRFESEKIEFFERVREGYLERVRENPDRYSIVDAGQSLENVQKDIALAIVEFCENQNSGSQ